ncbi:tRNA1(Val) (adenine(37)-N6)-methyltransferase [Sedimentibacter hydroxybenzoicus DSM 7310]|uniref:tRNA1(Val) (Adenine(37)-N6)-methyltransferase n=1 Tax=Sedimentibacter hydroxybenzoicus DSM 7310 TaxID=1123245 RepID=A0A974BHQ1_SEDHY|nr:tRNA1(Val) (adenine(37)-N6)-methyltransferase [Sedimentibacter hydroxybenzoicus]NYB73365.1 tRNA1(Val) (adenine(37)-N6)-methyltransferase [Sedimentibacter hydroxybenzoicus DSM 7310]
MNIELKENEKIEDLQCNGLKIIQNKKWFCFGMDAVLLTNYCDIKNNSIVVDLGTGTGIIPILLSGKRNYSKAYAIEIQEEVAEMARRSVMLNNLQDKIEVLNIDLKDVLNYLQPNSFDAVISNPPYKLNNSGIINPSDKKAISRHEIMCSLEDVISKASSLLKQYGRFYMVHRPDRLADIMCLLRKYRLEPKQIRFVHPRAAEKPNMILIRASKNGNPELKFDPPLYIYGEDGKYTKDVYDIYQCKATHIQ